MASNEDLRVQFDPDYTALVGTAVYVFAYYEWAVIYFIEQFERGFVARYCRKQVMPSGKVKEKLQSILDDLATVYTKVSRTELQDCCDLFGKLIDKRNALIHAHPMTDADGSQILNYQTKPDRPLPDMKWPVATVNEIIREFDAAALDASTLLQRML